MARSWRFWRAADEPEVAAAAGIAVSVGGNVGGDLVVGHNNILLHVHEAPAERPTRLRVVEARPVAAADLTDRPDIMRRLTALSGGGAAAVGVLAGRHGVGKTQLAAQCSRLRDDEGWEVVVWLPAESPEAIIAGWARLAEQISPTAAGAALVDPVEAAQAALAWINTQPVRGLIVFDNATDPDTVNRWRPTGGRIDVLVTTNNRQFRGIGTLIDVDVFDEAQSVDYLAARTGLTDPAGAAALAADLGHLPLALAQAASTIGADRRYRSYDKYGERLARLDVTTMLPRTPGDPYPLGLAEATLIAVDELDAGVRRLLNALGPLSADGVDVTLLLPLAKKVVPDSDPERMADAIDEWLQVLLDRSLASRSDDGRLVLVHRLVQRVLRDAARTSGTFTSAMTMAVNVLTVNMTYDADAQWPMREQLGSLGAQVMAVRQHLPADPSGDPDPRTAPMAAAVVALEQWYAWHLNEVANPVFAIEVGDMAIADGLRLLGPDFPGLLIARNNLADAHLAAGQAESAISLHAENLAAHVQAHGTDHPDTLTFRNNLAGSYHQAGRLDEAIELYETNLVDMTRILGPHDRVTLMSRNNLANAYTASGQSDRAIELHEANLAVLESRLGADHLDALTARNNLAHVCRSIGQAARAVELNETNLAALTRVFGPDHLMTLTARNNLALAYQAMEQLELAIPLFEAGLADRIRVLGPEHPATLISGSNLASAYQDAGRIEEAIGLFENVFDECRRLLGDEHPTTCAVAVNLDKARRKESRYCA